MRHAFQYLKPGWVRDFILYSDGWDKDGDINTLTSQTVEPLPFHGMSAYPYPDTEHYPDDAKRIGGIGLNITRDAWNINCHRCPAIQ